MLQISPPPDVLNARFPSLEDSALHHLDAVRQALQETKESVSVSNVRDASLTEMGSLVSRFSVLAGLPRGSSLESERALSQDRGSELRFRLPDKTGAIVFVTDAIDTSFVAAAVATSMLARFRNPEANYDRCHILCQHATPEATAFSASLDVEVFAIRPEAMAEFVEALALVARSGAPQEEALRFLDGCRPETTLRTRVVIGGIAAPKTESEYLWMVSVIGYDNVVPPWRPLRQMRSS